MNFEMKTPSPMQEIKDPLLDGYGVELFIKREDLIHPLVSGNKWRKLKYNLLQARKQGLKTMLTFGGAYSNHIYSVAAAGSAWGIRTIGIIRGEETLPLNPTLQFAVDNHMTLAYESRTAYREKETPSYLEGLKKRYGEVYVLPEGGSNELAVKGCAEIVQEISMDYDWLCCPCGTGGTIAGLVEGSMKGEVLGFSALKGDGMLNDKVKIFLQGKSGLQPWSINYDYHFGGYAKFSNELVSFIHAFELANGIALEPIYTGKMMYAIYDLIHKGYFKKGERIIALHTGGLQALAGLKIKNKGVWQ